MIIGILIGLIAMILFVGLRYEPLTDGLLILRSRIGGPLTDGLLILRHRFGRAATSLIRYVWGLRTIRPALDVDGNGQADALTERSISGSAGDPHETTGDGIIVSSYSVGGHGSEPTSVTAVNDPPGIPVPADYDGFKVAENESPRPMDRTVVTDDSKGGGNSSPRTGTINDPGSSL